MSLRESALRLISTKTHLSQRDQIDLEKGIYNWCIDYAISNHVMRNWENPLFRDVYRNKVRSVVGNLDINSPLKNMRLATRLAEQEFQPHDIAFMPPHNVYPEAWHDLVDTKMKKDQQIGVDERQSMTDQFVCGRCKKREVVYYEQQLRSADESSTIFCRCINCNNSWRIS